MQSFEYIFILIYLTSTLFLCAVGLNSYVSRARFLRKKARHDHGEPVNECLPEILVQLPIYNECNSVEQLIRCFDQIEYPREKLLIQILDDSDDETTDLIASLLPELKNRDCFEHIRRENRSGFKAGALDYGMRLHPNLNFIAIFDADFRPDPEFLLKAVSHLLKNPDLGLVQGRWEHSNEEESLFTRFQSVGMDGHFAIEQPARAWNGHLMNFNGTAGVWRREAIEQGGGWSCKTLTEDLDLSYRVQLRTDYRLDYLLELSCPAEIPNTINAFKSQQYRWAKGSTQTFLHLFKEVLFSGKSIFTKIEAFFHLTHYFVHPLLLANFLLGLYFISNPQLLHPYPVEWLYVLLLFACAGPSLLYRESRQALRKNSLPLYFYGLMICLGCGMAYNNTRAVLSALTGRESPFVRTPKKGEVRRKAYLSLSGHHWVIEILLACTGFYFLAKAGQIHSIISPFLLIYSLGFLVIGTLSAIEFSSQTFSYLNPVRNMEPTQNPIKSGGSKSALR